MLYPSGTIVWLSWRSYRKVSVADYGKKRNIQLKYSAEVYLFFRHTVRNVSRRSAAVKSSLLTRGTKHRCQLRFHSGGISCVQSNPIEKPITMISPHPPVGSGVTSWLLTGSDFLQLNSPNMFQRLHFQSLLAVQPGKDWKRNDGHELGVRVERANLQSGWRNHFHPRGSQIVAHRGEFPNTLRSYKVSRKDGLHS